MKFTITRTIKAQQQLSRKLISRNKTIAIVPTMGFLHEGHLSLIRRALKKADIVVTTIFVNPKQFAPGEDLDQYPRDTKGDLMKIKNAGAQVVFIPKMKDIYPDGYQTHVTVDNLTALLEGKSRPTHFRGVTTIVTKLFNIVRPDVALFGMKDYQQAMVLRRMTTDLNWPMKLIICPTVREKDGLALSSRNSYLSPEMRIEAAALYKSLMAAKKMAKAGEKSASSILKRMRQIISRMAPTARVDYIAFTEMESLKPVRRVQKNTVVSLAVRFDNVRLIDNMKIS
jgi:pantoate--beta-alanine ligase